MIGLQGSGIQKKLDIYFEKINLTLHEMKRVAKNDASIVIIIGTNDIQTKGVILESRVVEMAKNIGLKFEMEMSKPIRGLQNTMKNESILFFKKL